MALDTKIGDLRQQQEIAVARAETAPSDDEILPLESKISLINAVISPRAKSLSTVLVALEVTQPRDVWLSQFVYQEQSGALNISAQSYEEKELAKFLALLEEEPQFQLVLLARQSRFTYGDRQALQFDIELQAQ